MLYPDTSFLIPLYTPERFSPIARDILAKSSEPCILSGLNLFEFRQAVRLHVFRYRHNPAQGLPRRQAEMMLQAFNENIAAGLFELRNTDFTEVFAEAERLSARHTAPDGCRSYDILHVAAALHLGASALLSFDQGQRELAAVAKLAVLPAKLP